MYAMQWDRKIVDLVEFLSCFTTFNKIATKMGVSINWRLN